MINWQFGLMIRVVFFVSALPISLSTVLAKDVKAADLKTTNRTVVVLFSGFGELTFTGLNTVNQNLQTQLGGNQDEPFSSRVFADFDLDKAMNYVESFDDIENFVVIGDGFGGSSAYEIAEKIQPNSVDLLVETNGISRPSLNQTVNIDQFEDILEGGGFTNVEQKANDVFKNKQSITFRETEIQFLNLAQSQNYQNISLSGAYNVIKQSFPIVDLSSPPKNVSKGINYFYTSVLPEIQGVKNINGFTNIDVNKLLREPNLFNISSIKVVQDGITDSVKEVVNNSQSIPESNSILGQLIAVLVAPLLILKHKTKKVTSKL